ALASSRSETARDSEAVLAAMERGCVYLTYMLINVLVNKAHGLPQHHLHGPCRPNAARDPRAARAEQCHGGPARRALRHFCAGHLASPQGARAGQADPP